MSIQSSNYQKLINDQHITQPTQTLVLIASEFDETAVITTTCHLRDEGFSVRIISLHSGLVTGRHGITLRPDHSLAQHTIMPILNNARSLIISGGTACASSLLSDPRIHQLIQSIQNQGGTIATMASAQRLLSSVGGSSIFTSPNFLLQNEMQTTEFVHQLINRLL